METDSECLIAADYCEEHGCIWAAELLRSSEEVFEHADIDFDELIKAVHLCAAWPNAKHKIFNLGVHSAQENSRLRGEREVRERLEQLRVQSRDSNMAERLLWRRRGGHTRGLE